MRRLRSLLIVLILLCTACGDAAPESRPETEKVTETGIDPKMVSSSAESVGSAGSPAMTAEERPDMMTEMETDDMTETAFALKMKIGETPVEVTWEDNEAVRSLKAFVEEGTVTIRTSMYGGFEQVGPIGRTLPSKDERVSTEPGDLVLYQSSQLVVFYGTNTWEYTRLGKIIDRTPEQLEELLGQGGVVITLYMEQI